MIIKDTINPVLNWTRVLKGENLKDTLAHIRTPRVEDELAKKICIPLDLQILTSPYKSLDGKSDIIIHRAGREVFNRVNVSVVGYPGIVEFDYEKSDMNMGDMHRLFRLWAPEGATGYLNMGLGVDNTPLRPSVDNAERTSVLQYCHVDRAWLESVFLSR